MIYISIMHQKQNKCKRLKMRGKGTATSRRGGCATDSAPVAHIFLYYEDFAKCSVHADVVAGVYLGGGALAAYYCGDA